MKIENKCVAIHTTPFNAVYCTGKTSTPLVLTSNTYIKYSYTNIHASTTLTGNRKMTTESNANGAMALPRINTSE